MIYRFFYCNHPGKYIVSELGSDFNRQACLRCDQEVGREKWFWKKIKNAFKKLLLKHVSKAFILILPIDRKDKQELLAQHGQLFF